MKLNHKYTFKPYIKWLLFCRHLLQTENGEPLPEDKWLSDDYWKRWYPELFPDSSSELEDEQEQVGHSFAVFFVKIHFSSVSVILFIIMFCM